MGCGVADPNRRWPHTIAYAGEPTANLRAAFEAWTRRLGSLSLHPAADGEPALFVVEIMPSKSSVWRSGDGLNGRAPGHVGKLVLGREEPVGVALHEVGHLLGLAHEQDRQDCPEAKRWVDARLTVDPRYAFMLEAVNAKKAHYRNIGPYNPNSIMLYGNGYAAMTEVSDGDAAAVKEIHGIA